MFKRVIQLFKIARKLGSSGATDTINRIYKTAGLKVTGIRRV